MIDSSFAVVSAPFSLLLPPETFLITTPDLIPCSARLFDGLISGLSTNRNKSKYIIYKRAKRFKA